MKVTIKQTYFYYESILICSNVLPAVFNLFWILIRETSAEGKTDVTTEETQSNSLQSSQREMVYIPFERDVFFSPQFRKTGTQNEPTQKALNKMN